MSKMLTKTLRRRFDELLESIECQFTNGICTYDAHERFRGPLLAARLAAEKGDLAEFTKHEKIVNILIADLVLADIEAMSRRPC